jgi:hypothetical protein
MDTIGYGDGISGTDFHTASAGHTFSDTHIRFSFGHNKLLIVFYSVYRGNIFYSVMKSQNRQEDITEVKPNQGNMLVPLGNHRYNSCTDSRVC